MRISQLRLVTYQKLHSILHKAQQSVHLIVTQIEIYFKIILKVEQSFLPINDLHFKVFSTPIKSFLKLKFTLKKKINKFDTAYLLCA